MLIQREFSFYTPPVRPAVGPHNFAYSQVVGMGAEGLVAIATCTLPEFPAPAKRFAVKAILNYYGMTGGTLARKREAEVEIARCLPKVRLSSVCAC